MPAIKMILDGDRAWPELQGVDFHHVTETMQIALLKKGMQSGKSSVAIRLDLPNGEVVVAETSLALFVSTARAFEARDEAFDQDT